MKKSNKKRILICGGTGFIGQNLTKELLRQGKKINLLAYDKIPSFLRHKNLNVFKGSILDKESLKRALEKSDIVVNLVGSFNEDVYLINVLGSLNLLEACKESSIEKIVFISSEAVYGEYMGRPNIESDCPTPTTEYGFSKYIAEKAYEYYSGKYKIPIIVLRLSSTYGLGQRTGVGVMSSSLYSAFENKPLIIHGDGKQLRDFLYIDDAVSGIIKSINYKTKGFEVFNISGVKEYSLLDLISLIEKQLGKKMKIKFLKSKKQDIKHMYSSYGKAKRVLNYIPKTSLKEGILKTADCFKK